jgi:hypothetical protein
MPRRIAMNERLPYVDMRKLALLTREKFVQYRVLTETDQLFRYSRDLSRMGPAGRTGQKKDPAD